MSGDGAQSDWWDGHRGNRFFARLRRRILLSLGASVAWICFTLLYVAFWARGFSVFQSIVVVLVSFLVLVTVVIGAWISFGLHFRESGFD
jgi:hypothetical protein